MLQCVQSENRHPRNTDGDNRNGTLPTENAFSRESNTSAHHHKKGTGTTGPNATRLLFVCFPPKEKNTDKVCRPRHLIKLPRRTSQPRSWRGRATFLAFKVALTCERPDAFHLPLSLVFPSLPLCFLFCPFFTVSKTRHFRRVLLTRPSRNPPSRSTSRKVVSVAPY